MFQACHVHGVGNELADALSRQQIGRFRELAPEAQVCSGILPLEVWSIGMEHWTIEANRAISLAIAPSTRSSYAASCEEFCTICKCKGMGMPWPITVDHLQQFAVRLHLKGLAPHTIQGRMSALAFYAKAMGHVWEAVWIDQYEVKLFKAATLCTFWGAFRINELVTASKLDNSQTVLQRNTPCRWDGGVI